MTINELAKILANMYANAVRGENKGVVPHIFGIKYASEIKNNYYSPKSIIEVARKTFSSDIPTSYGTEIYKGTKLEKYVTLNQKHLEDLIDKS
ncbi:MAG: hypothetical protein LBT74_11070 [Acidobacteriota bacterium]|jgi:hypothetical protein|nr:hypothetical protein [Acidobacteriota bacterium]